MRILLSAYACIPGRGSEPGVGWNWAIQLTNIGNEVWVITRKVYQDEIETELKKDKYSHIKQNLKFIYYELPFWKKREAKPAQLHYLIWQIGILKIALRINKETEFDWVQHITFGVFRHPSYLYLLGKPFIFGPVGGGETTPLNLLKSFPFKNKVKESFRYIINLFAYMDPLLRIMYKKTDIIYCKTSDTLEIIPKKYRYKTKLKLEIGTFYTNNIQMKSKYQSSLKILFVGRLEYWKGLHLALKSFALYNQDFQDSTFHIIGTGRDKHYFIKLCSSLNLENSVYWYDWIDRDKLLSMYSDFDVFLFPSLHDSSGNVILESISNGLPVICLDIGGPATMIDNNCGIIINTFKKSEKEVIINIAETLKDLTNNPTILKELSNGAKNKRSNYTWEKIVGNSYEEIKRYVNELT